MTENKTRKTISAGPAKQNESWVVLQLVDQRQLTGRAAMASSLANSWRWWHATEEQFGWGTRVTVALMLSVFMVMANRTRYILVLRRM